MTAKDKKTEPVFVDFAGAPIEVRSFNKPWDRIAGYLSSPILQVNVVTGFALAAADTCFRGQGAHYFASLCAVYCGSAVGFHWLNNRTQKRKAFNYGMDYEKLAIDTKGQTPANPVVRELSSRTFSEVSAYAGSNRLCKRFSIFSIRAFFRTYVHSILYGYPQFALQRENLKRTLVCL